MFNTLASYLLGNSISSSSTCGANKKKEEENHDNRTGDADSPSADRHNLLRTVADDDDWLLVERDCIADDDVSLPRTDSEEELPIVEIKNSPLVTKTRHNSRHAEPSTALVAVNSMEESWFVTPPSCFTGTQAIHMETSPLENLLIEHPSMSVYHSIRGPSQPIENDMVVLNYEAEENQPHPADERIVNHTTRVSARVRRSDRVVSLEEKQGYLYRNAQMNHDKKQRQKLCRNALIRSNKTNEVNAKNGRQKRSDKQHSKNASRANNNRKC
ncbi:tumor protein p53-inducible nuclear protein 2 isoform X2 [Phlebotomus papatasi]|uniref:Tumor protein p53-inducible nuclear protein 1 n=1 Tax=Phlebotomus papatasi TaxID=29031 RepID=A0A1B0DAL8_PHLPP|nr:tumor protein p53-inducible nuclear protein 2 isoform X2 [Phlebotomus papatasi]XP_055707390.1 tumor protein p53-inducible nuclear protein 2 isoform X2 [Phlebotomus papatasi]